MNILFFAQARNLSGCAEYHWETTQAVDADGLWRHLIDTFPALASVRPQTRLARNGEMADAKTLFEPGDEVALIPPVSGG